VAASTVHRALFSSRSRSIAASELLPADVIVVDEASMVDLSLMASLLRRSAPDSRVILLGDKDQLASVEAGAVLGDLCRVAADPRVRERAPRLSSSIAVLTRPYRFRAGGHIAQLAVAVQAGDVDRVLSLLREGSDEIEWLTPEARAPGATAPPGLDPRLAQAAARAYAPLFSSAPAAQRLACLSRYRVLCAHRMGRFGALSVNLEIERSLRALQLVKDRSPRYDGKPIMVVDNDYDVHLYNGDVGILLRGESLRAGFLTQDGNSVRELSIARVPSHETVYAMTVHKSQGSEADEVVLVLPTEPSPIVSRELLYTAVTRAREKVVLYASEQAVVAATRSAVRRSTGLLDALAQELDESP
jgi:exodeoxyribonuclease V alpha subunit